VILRKVQKGVRRPPLLDGGSSELFASLAKSGDVAYVQIFWHGLDQAKIPKCLHMVKGIGIGDFSLMIPEELV